MSKKQPEALRLAEMLTANEWPGHVTLVSYVRECVAELLRQHAENETLRAGYAAARLEIESLRLQAPRQGAAYAALPVPNYPKSGGFPGTFAEAQMRAFADATCALRAPHGQAPAKPDPAYSAACNLATALFKKHFAHLPDFASGQAVWGLCGSTAGVISQIDNMVSGLVQPPTTSPQADSVQEDAALWRWLAEYLVGPRTDLDDELVACETVDDMRKLVKAAIKQGEKQ